MTTPPKEVSERQFEQLSERLRTLEAAGNVPAVTHELQTHDGASPMVRSKPLDTLAGIDQRIAEATPPEALAWLQIRDELIRQNEKVRDRDHLRAMEKFGVGGKLALSGIAIVSGVALAFGDFGLPAFLCLGAGLFNLAPNFVMAMAKGFRSGGKQ